MAVVFRFRDCREDLNILHQALDLTVVSSSFCAPSNPENQDLLCHLGCDLVQCALLYIIGTYRDPPMCRQSRNSRNNLYRHLRSSGYRVYD